MKVAVGEIEELNRDFGRVGGDLGVRKEEVKETSIARFEGRVDGVCSSSCCWGVAVGDSGEGIAGGMRVFEHGVHPYMHKLLVMS